MFVAIPSGSSWIQFRGTPSGFAMKLRGPATQDGTMPSFHAASKDATFLQRTSGNDLRKCVLGRFWEGIRSQAVLFPNDMTKTRVQR